MNDYRAFVRARSAADDVAFAEYVSDRVYPAHLDELVAFLACQRRALVLLPRGHGKTTVVNHAVARLIGERAGRVKIGILTESEKDAVKRSLDIRRIVERSAFAEVFPWARQGVSGAKWTKTEWTVRGAEDYVEKDATLTASSLMGLKPGPRFDVLILDDLIGPDEVTTAAMRARTLDRFSTVIEPMLVPDGIIWALGTRWHEDDLYATFASQFGWPVHLRKAIDNDQALWPEYWSIELLRAKRTELGSAIFDLQYQNDPSGMGGNIFNRKWFQYVTTLPPGSRRVGMDLAASTKERSDYTAAVEWWEDAELNLYLVGSFRARLDEGHRVWLTGLTEEKLNEPSVPVTDGVGLSGPRLLWPTNRLPAGFAGVTGVNDAPRPLSRLNLEATQWQSTFSKEVLAKTRLPAMPVYPDTDKVTRARTLAARYEAGKVFHLRSAPGLHDFEQELVAFPNSEHDDQVDAAVHGADLNTASEFHFVAGRR